MIASRSTCRARCERMWFHAALAFWDEQNDAHIFAVVQAPRPHARRLTTEIAIPGKQRADLTDVHDEAFESTSPNKGRFRRYISNAATTTATSTTNTTATVRNRSLE